MYLKKKYRGIWSYLKEAKNYFLVVFLLFILSSLFGFLFPVFLREYIRRFVEDLLAKTKGMGFLELLTFILQNNLYTAFMGMILGIAFGVLPLVYTFMNGYVIGYVSNAVVGEAGYRALLSLVPHGIFEIPALILSLGLGLKLGMFVWAKEKKKQLLYDLRKSLEVFVFVILPLLVIAAFIETGLMFLIG